MVTKKEKELYKWIRKAALDFSPEILQLTAEGNIRSASNLARQGNTYHKVLVKMVEIFGEDIKNE